MYIFQSNCKLYFIHFKNQNYIGRLLIRAIRYNNILPNHKSHKTHYAHNFYNNTLNIFIKRKTVYTLILKTTKCKENDFIKEKSTTKKNH